MTLGDLMTGINILTTNEARYLELPWTDAVIASYEWIPATSTTNLVRVPKYRYQTNIIDGENMTRNFITFDVQRTERVEKTKIGHHFQYQVETEPGYWK